VPNRVFQVVLFTEDIDEAVRFLVDVAGMENPRWYDSPGPGNATVFPGWPAHVSSRRVVLGEGPGLVELVAIPPELRGTIEPGIALLALATPDVEGHADRAASAGFGTGDVVTVLGPDEPSTLALVRAGGLPWQFIRFGS
jgi:catechol 2,3-dioxygenase-like lactoylglutathione lyase family enzyme